MTVSEKIAAYQRIRRLIDQAAADMRTTTGSERREAEDRYRRYQREYHDLRAVPLDGVPATDGDAGMLVGLETAA